MKANLQSASIEDILAMMTLDRQCFPPGEAFSLEEFYFYLYYLDSISLIYRDKSIILGFIIFSKLDEYWELVTLDIKPEEQGKGIGTYLLKEGFEKVKERSSEPVYLHVRVDNEKAINLYRKFGFNVVKTVKNYYNNRQDAYLMHKE